MPGTDRSVPGSRTVYLTLDIEPDYGRCRTLAILDRAGEFLDWARHEQVPLTAFVTGRLIEQGHPVVAHLQSAGASVELHGYEHALSGFGTMRDSHAEEIERGTAAYAKRFGRLPAGYRAPAGVIGAEDIRLLNRLGYGYDSSIFPVRRPGRYDCRHLPHSPFRWEDLRLLEFPIALLTSRIPAGLTFINLLGPRLSARLLLRAAPVPPSPLVLDGHLHNLFQDRAARANLPWKLRGIYALGQRAGGLPGLRTLVEELRRRGCAFGNLTAAALAASSELLPSARLW